ncbi:MAG: RHS repeat-associated core domain-containing protein, partial [Blastocatellia bacterium]
WGNQTIDNGATWGNAINNLAYTVSSTNNRINGVTYDAAGNVTSDPNGVSTATYDGENRMKSALKSGAQSYYVYDADGKRARRIISGVETWQVYGIEGELVAEYPVNGAVGAPQKEYGYRSGQMLIVGDATNVRWTVTDALGTPRIVAGKTGALSEVTRHDYLPFGEELYVGMGSGSIRTTGMGYSTGGTNDGIRKKFTSKERDDETGLDYFGARHYSSIQGRFTSADLPVVDLVPANPQSMNRYAYVRNNPCSNIDPNGRCSAPAGLKRGQVGICVEAFIATKRLPGLMGLGRGDGRGPSGNDPKLTSRIEAKLIASPNSDGKGYSVGTPQVKAAKSEVDVPLGVTVAHPRHPAGGSITISLQGTGSTNTPEGKVDQSGNTSFTLTGAAQNGFQANNLPGPGGTIDFKLDFQISPNGTASVNLETSTTKEYPTYAAYSYGIDDQGNVKVTELFVRPEKDIDALRREQTPIKKKDQ